MQMNYTNNQTSLKLELDWTPKENHIVWAIDSIVESIPMDELTARSSWTGRPEYPAKMLLKMLLFAYSRKTFSGRLISEMAEENLPMRWLMGNVLTVPSYRTINRFRVSDKNKELVELLFVTFRNRLNQLGLIDDSALFIDGTKLLANANKFTFVWRKSHEKFEPKLDEKAVQLYKELIQENVDISIKEESDVPLTSKELADVSDQLDSNINELDKIIENEPVKVGGSKNKRLRRKLKHYNHLLKNDLIPRKKKYEVAKGIFGDRNSFSKTDTDATFMRMKEDPMKNGQLKPGYNLQVASQNQFALYYDIYQRPTDTRTLIPFLTDIFNQTPHAADYVVADAGYGSEMNYQFITDELNAEYLIPYGMYEKELTRSYHKDKKKVANWNYNEFDDVFTDLDGIEFHFLRYSIRHDKYGFERKFKVYRAIEYFYDPIRQEMATTKMGNPRQISINANWEYFKNKAKESLSSEVGQSVYAQRKTDVEPIFANLKAHLSFNRVSVRGLENVKVETGLALMANNLAKIAKLFVLSYRISKNEMIIPIIGICHLVFIFELGLMSRSLFYEINSFRNCFLSLKNCL